MRGLGQLIPRPAELHNQTRVQDSESVPLQQSGRPCNRNVDPIGNLNVALSSRLDLFVLVRDENRIVQVGDVRGHLRLSRRHAPPAATQHAQHTWQWRAVELIITERKNMALESCQRRGLPIRVRMQLVL